MAELIVIGIFAAVYFIAKARLESKVNHYDMSKVSIGKMAMDSDKSKFEIKRNLVNGKYDKDGEWKL